MLRTNHIAKTKTARTACDLMFVREGIRSGRVPLVG